MSGQSDQPPSPPGTPQSPPPAGTGPGSGSSSLPPPPPSAPGGPPSAPSSPPAGGGSSTSAAPPGGGYAGPPPGAGGGDGAPPVLGGYGGPPAGPAFGAPGQLSQQDERTWGMGAHISAIVASIIGLSFLGPLLVMLLQGPKSQFVRRHSVESLNFQITTYIALFVSFLLIFVIIGFVLLFVVGIAWLVFTIIAGLAANRGEDYRYPVNIRLVK